MLKSLRLLNFQAHTKLTLDLGPLVTCLVGRSDVGKSSVLRALRWLCCNQPSGVEFIRHGEDRCMVVLELDNHIVKRKRQTPSHNTFVLDGRVFKAFGQGVPSEIVKLLDLSPVFYQSQLESPFWLTLPAPQVSRELNAIVNLGTIDDALHNAASHTRKAKTTLEVTEERLATAKQEVESLGYVDELDKDLQQLELYESKVSENRQKQALAASILSDAVRLKEKADRVSCAKAEAFSLVSLADRVRESADRCDRLMKLCADLTELQEQLVCLSTAKAEIETELKTLEKDGCPLCGRPLARTGS